MKINWQAVPFVRIAIPLILGVVCGLFWDNQISCISILLLICFLLLLFLISIYFAFRMTDYAHRWQFVIPLNSFFICLGFLLVYFKYEIHDPWHFKHFLSEQNVVIAKIEEVNRRNNYHRLKVLVKGFKQQPESFQKCRGHLLVYLKDSSKVDLKKGNIILFRTQIRPIAKAQNPEAFNFKNYWLTKNLFYQGFVEKYAWKLLERGKGRNLIGEIRNQSIQYLKSFSSKEDAIGVAIALLLGNKDYLSDDIKEKYAGAGAMHVLAVSGLHVGVIAGILGFLFQWIGRKDKRFLPLKILLLIVGVFSFALLTGASASVLRTSLMFCILCIGNLLSHRQNIYNTLAASAFIILSIDILQILNIGFQLSYLAVLGIVFFQPKIYRLWYVENRAIKYIWTLTSVGFAAQISTLPLSLFYFQQFPTYFWLSGPPIILCATAGLVFGLLCLLFSWWPMLSHFFGNILSFCTDAMNEVAGWIYRLPGSLYTDLWISPLMLGLLYLVLVNVILGMISKQFRWVLTGLLFFCLISFKHALYQWSVTTQKGIVIYHIPGQTALDFFEKDRVISLCSPNINVKKLAYAAENFRVSKNIKEVIQIPTLDTVVQQNNWWYAKGFIKFHHIRMAILSHPIENGLTKKLKVNYLLIRSNPRVSISQVLQVFEFEQVIFDKSNSSYRVKNWIRECKHLNIPYHDMQAQGALVVTL